MTRRLGVFGGTFDPVHFGHLDAAAAARSALALDEVLFVPSSRPPHRPLEPHASEYHRFALLSLAISGIPGYRASETELQRGGASYTADTLRQLNAAGWAPWQLFFIIGADAVAEIATWRAFPEVMDAASFAVVARPGTTTTAALSRTPALRPRIRSASSLPAPEGQTGVFVIEAATRQVSSTMIRERLAEGRRIDDLTPPAVAWHIVAHRLYNTEDDLHGENTSTQR